MVGCLLSTWDTGKGHTPMLCIASSFPSPAWHGQSLGPPFQLHQVYQHMITNSQCDRESPVLEGHDVTSWETNHHEGPSLQGSPLWSCFHRCYSQIHALYGWLFQPNLQKYTQVTLDHFPKLRDKHKTSLKQKTLKPQPPVDGSEIPFPTTWDGAKTLYTVNNGIIYLIPYRSLTARPWKSLKSYRNPIRKPDRLPSIIFQGRTVDGWNPAPPGKNRTL